MSSQRLLSTVFVLRYKRAFRSGEKYMGRAAHRLALDFIETIEQPLGRYLHDYQGILPLTVSDLFQTDSHHHWLRLTALRADIVDVLLQLVDETKPSRVVDGWTIVLGAECHHEWTGETDSAELVSRYFRPVQDIRLQFYTATCFKSMDLYRPYPDPTLVFKSAYERWQALINLPLPFQPTAEAWDDFLQYFVAIVAQDTIGQNIPMKHGTIPAFKGDVTYRIERDNEALRKRGERDDNWQLRYNYLVDHHTDFVALLNLLAHLMFYSAVGIKTAQGMGMVRVL